ncbi:MAG TPA: GNAT family N-acetyltransferase [Candidatus Limnocylindrales bacterium]|nr:GNAT family N-acetyltransferase [Candidatus Limnocylindrales bacterium]
MLPKSNRKSKINIKVRPMKPRDFEGVVRNYYEAQDEAKRNPWIGIFVYAEKPPIKDERKWFRETLAKAKKGDGFALVAEVEGEIVGATDVWTKTAQQDQRHVGMIGLLVREDYRNMGVGTALLSALIERAKQQGKYELLVLSVFANNEHARHLYRKLGFAEFGVLPKGLKRNGEYVDEIYMYRTL